MAFRLQETRACAGNDDAMRMRQFSLKGIIIGGFADVIATIVLDIAIAIVFLVTSGALHAPHPEAAMQALFSQGPSYDVLLAVGILCSALGGYVAAWLAKHDELLNGACSAWLCMFFGLISIFAAAGTDPLWLRLLWEVISPTAALIGGYLRFLQVRGNCPALG